MIDTPQEVIAELQHIRNQSEKGIELLAVAERKLAELELAAEKKELTTFLNALGGTVKDREAQAKLASAEAHFEANLAKAEVSRIKTKLKHLSESQMAIQTMARMLENEWKL